MKSEGRRAYTGGWRSHPLAPWVGQMSKFVGFTHKSNKGCVTPLICRRLHTVHLHRLAAVHIFFWQDDLVDVSEFLCECMDIMLGADSNDQSQTSDQPYNKKKQLRP